MFLTWGVLDGRVVSVGRVPGIQIAQAYPGQHDAGDQVGEVISFLGYHTLFYEMDGNVAGMHRLSASPGQVWEHLWHEGRVEPAE